VALGQVFSEYFLFPLSIFIPPNSPSSQSPGAGTIGQKWPTCRVEPVWTALPTMRNGHFGRKSASKIFFCSSAQNIFLSKFTEIHETYIDSLFFRLIRSSEHHIGRHCCIYRQTEGHSFGDHLISGSVSVTPSSVIHRSFYCALFLVFMTRDSQCPTSL
jgi:hypothetical protein